MGAVAIPPSEAIALSPRAGPAVCVGGAGGGVGMGAGGGCVTNVIVAGVASCWPAAVRAPGPIVTWYCVLGARLPLVGCTASVLDSHEKVTVVAGVIWTAPWVDAWSICWLNETRIGCCRATPVVPSIELLTTTRVRPLVGCRAMYVATEVISTTPAAAPSQARPGGAKARLHQESRPSLIDHAWFISWRRRPERKASSIGGSARSAALRRVASRRSSSS